MHTATHTFVSLRFKGRRRRPTSRAGAQRACQRADPGCWPGGRGLRRAGADCESGPLEVPLAPTS
eukprot:9596041-Alexandrium_andersonii.AAC.1